MRLFTAITLPQDIKNKLKISADKIKAACEKGNFPQAENYHITLVFLGDIPESRLGEIKSAMEKAAKDAVPFNLVCLEPSHFSKGSRKIMYFSVGGETGKLEALQNSLYKSLYAKHLCDRQEKYTAHITFARQVKADSYPDIYQKIDFTAGSIALMHSHRVDGKLTYSPIHTVPFKKAILT